MIRSPIATAILCAALAACSVETDTGSVQVALTGTAPSGALYRLRQAELIVTGGGTTRTFSSETDPDLPSISVPLPPGPYSLGMPTGWFLQRRRGDGAWQRVDATLLTPNPQTFAISEDATTQVTLRFLAEAEEVPLHHGRLDVEVGIEETADLPSPDAAIPDAPPPTDAAPPPDAAQPPDASVPGGPVASGDDMRPGEILPVGVVLRPPGSTSTSTFQVQADGNVVLRSGSSGAIYFQSNTAGLGGTVLVMQTDGNLVLQRADGLAIWTSNTGGNPGAYLVVESQIFFGTRVLLFSASGSVLWQRP
jgi:hypothetical protein